MCGAGPALQPRSLHPCALPGGLRRGPAGQRLRVAAVRERAARGGSCAPSCSTWRPPAWASCSRCRCGPRRRRGRWPFGEGLCKLSSFALAGTRCAGALLLAGLGVDSYLAVGRPLAARSPRSRRCALAACAGVWAAALAAGLPSLALRACGRCPAGATASVRRSRRTPSRA